MKLTEKQKKFAEEYIISGNATQAAIRAGYAKRSAKSVGNENLTKPDLKSYIDERLEILRNERTADAQEVLEYLTSVMRGEQVESILLGLGKGEQVLTENEVTAKDRIKAAELLGKRHALFTEKTEITGEGIQVTIIDDIPRGAKND